VELTRNVPRTMSGASTASSAETWFKRPQGVHGLDPDWVSAR
jgi:hypothetical protein